MALLLLACGLSAVVMELGLRVVAPQPPSWLDVYRRHPHLPTYALQGGIERIVDTGETRWTIRTDDRGFRVSAAGNDEDDRPVALWLGDSFTFAHGVDHEDSFVGRLDERSAGGYRFVNAAIVGHGPVQYRQILESVIADGLDPKLVLVGVFLGNDFYDCIWSKDIPVFDGVLGDDRSLKATIKKRSHLYRLLARLYHRLHGPEAGGALPPLDLYDAATWRDGPLNEAARRFEEELARIAEICRSRSIPLFVVLLPPREWVVTVRDPAPDTTPKANALPLERAGAILDDLAIRWMDLTPHLVTRPTEEIFFHFDGHYTPTAHELVVDAIREHCPELSDTGAPVGEGRRETTGVTVGSPDP